MKGIGSDDDPPAYDGHDVRFESRETGWTSLDLRTFHYQPHEHPEFSTVPSADQAVLVALSGSQLIEKTGGARLASARLMPGSVGLTPGGQVDRLRYRGRGSLTFARIGLPTALMADVSEGLRLRTDSLGAPALNELARHDPMVLKVAFSLIDGARRGLNELYAESAAYWLSSYLCAGAREYSVKSELTDLRLRNHDARIRRCLELIENRISTSLTLDELSAEASLSKYHLLRLFKKETGTTPMAFLQRRRIEHAKVLLLTTRVQVGVIGFQCGFARQSEFAMAFKRHVGCSPRTWRSQGDAGCLRS